MTDAQVYELLRDIVAALEPYDARDSEWLDCLICRSGTYNEPHKDDCAYVRALELVREREGWEPWEQLND